MSFATLISADELAGQLDDAACTVVDARFSLNDPGRGYRDYLAGHIPGAIYVHLADDLSGPIVKGKTGRHPLPSVEIFADRLGRWGIDNDTRVAVYDDAGGAIASRLWWMLRWLGHDAVAVLDGGMPQWIAQGRPTVGGNEKREPCTFMATPRPDWILNAADVLERLNDPAWKIVDSRTPDRFSGAHEPVDPVAGRIPGAVNAPHPDVLNKEGLFLSPAQLRDRLGTLLRDHRVERTVFYCGSGVTAAHNLLAMAHAGLGDARLYPGSWSDWITDPNRPIATGAEQPP